MSNSKDLIRKEIPIFFATDDNYIPFLDVALRSLITNASREYNYVVNVLNTGLKQENIDKIKKLENKNFVINFCNISEQIKEIKAQLKNVYHFSVVMYYRLFIETLFPQYDKVIYLDCDIIVLGDISKFYNTNLGDNLVGAIQEQVVNSKQEFIDYAENALGIYPVKKYFNSGILLMNLAKFREYKIQDKFVYLIKNYNFDVIDPDQAYLNVLCKDRVHYFPNGWNKEALSIELEGELNIVHYALYKKPWQYDDVINVDYFWHYAKQSPFYNDILQKKTSFTDEIKLEKEKSNVAIVEHSVKVTNSPNNMFNTLFKGVIDNKQTFDVLSILDDIMVGK